MVEARHVAVVVEGNRSEGKLIEALLVEAGDVLEIAELHEGGVLAGAGHLSLLGDFWTI
jgi:hypothetical protein